MKTSLADTNNRFLTVSLMVSYPTSSLLIFLIFILHSLTGCTRRRKPCFHDTATYETQSHASIRTPCLISPIPAPIIVLDGLVVLRRRCIKHLFTKTVDRGCSIVLVGRLVIQDAFDTKEWGETWVWVVHEKDHDPRVHTSDLFGSEH